MGADMSRSGYVDEMENQWQLIRWRGAVTSAIRGRRGQAFLKKLIKALDALPEKKLIKGELEQDGEVCAIGAVGVAEGVNMEDLDPYDPASVSARFDISEALAREITCINDEYESDPEKRFAFVRKWAERNLKKELSDENQPGGE